MKDDALIPVFAARTLLSRRMRMPLGGMLTTPCTILALVRTQYKDSMTLDPSGQASGVGWERGEVRAQSFICGWERDERGLTCVLAEITISAAREERFWSDAVEHPSSKLHVTPRFAMHQQY
jgi:hypothetical protein